MLDFFLQLLDTASFPARWYCGRWSTGLGWLHIGSDTAIFGAYAAIPVTLIYFIRKRRDVPFPPIFWLFSAFIFLCGFGHLIEASIFWKPWYRFSGLVKVLTAVVSWMTVVALIRVIPQALELPGLSKANALLAREVAERKEIERALRVSEERNRALIAATQSITWNASPGGMFVTPQESWEAFTGQSWDRHRERGWLNAVHGDDRDALLLAWDRAMERGTAMRSACRICKHDGTFCPVIVRAAPLVDADGQVREWVGICIDISRQQLAEQELRRSEERFRLFVEAVKDYAIILLTPQGTISTWNVGAERLTGHSPDEAVGQPICKLYSPEDIALEKPARALELAARDGSHESEGWRVRKDGSMFWATSLITVLRDETDRLVGFGEVTRDLTDRLRANEQLRLTMDAAPTGMLTVNSQGEIVMVNAQVERLFGYAREELLGQSVETLVPQRLRNNHPDFRAHFFLTPQVRPMGAGRDLFGIRKDGSEVAVEIALNPLNMREGQFVLCSITDITERKRAERLREDLTARLQNANRDLTASLKEREVLLQEVHHRVKNNLQVISSLVNMQARKLPPGVAQAAFSDCQTRIQTIALIHEKLYQSKDYSCVPFSEYARTLVRYVFDATGTALDRVELELAIDDVALSVDRAIPCGLLVNELVTNALKHGFVGNRRGVVRVELTVESDGMLRLSVRDSGMGFPPNFDIRGSVSLGLQLVCSLAEQLGAELRAENDDGAAIHLRFSAGD